jgi:Mg2+ and Co2+ transporter CorA
MIRASLYRDRAAHPEDVPVDQLADAIEPEKALLWVDCVEPTDAELDSLTTQLQISALAAEDLHNAGQRTKLEHYREHFHVAVHDCAILEADLAVMSNRTNKVMKRMTSWGAILLGSTLIAGIYGMNFTHMPELDWVAGYPLAVGSMLVLTIFLYTWFKRRDWL